MSITFRQEANRMYHLWNRIAKLERYQEETDEDSAVTIRLVFEGQRESDQIPLEPGARVLHVEFDRQAWWGEVGEDGRERWVSNV